MKTLFILNDAPYGNERCYNALRLARELLKNDPDAKISVFLMADAAVAACKGQKTPEGYYNVERMLKQMLVAKNTVLLCGTCMDARGMGEEDIIDGARRSTMDELAAETRRAEGASILSGLRSNAGAKQCRQKWLRPCYHPC